MQTEHFLTFRNQEFSIVVWYSIRADDTQGWCACFFRQVEDLGQTERRAVSGEEQLTLITESMSITSADQEKLQLLNKNTELRRLNKEVEYNT